MIKISQIKVPVKLVCQRAPADAVKHGILSEEELALVKKAVAEALHIRPDQIHGLQVLRRSMDARKKHQMQFIYQVTVQAPGERQLIKRYGKGNARLVEESPEKRSEGLIGAGNQESPGAVSGEQVRAGSQKQPGAVSGEQVRTGSQKQSGAASGEWMQQHVIQQNRSRPVVVGMGPAGLFAALTLAQAGYAPLVLERGADVDTRHKLVARFWETGELDTDCNVQFGEGGAGTFSDGKLNTLVKDPTGRGRRVLQTLVQYGAPGEILYLQKPHIGTDRLRDVVKGIRQKIIELGGVIQFGTTLERAVWSEGTLRELVVRHQGKERTLSCDTLILATGHSARDTVTQLYQEGLSMEAKPFAVGVRVEHSQELIGRNQYGELYQKLPTADYKLTYTTAAGRGVYSFCMCPGGYVVNASSEPGRLVVNGMSDYARDSENANSAIVVTVSPSDYGGEDALSGIAFQRKWEEAAFRAGAGKIPVQLLGDFLRGRRSTTFGTVLPCMKGAYALADVRSALPDFVGDAIAEGMNAFDRRIPGYAAADTVLAGIESRTSSPVRICRDETLQANVKGIYPCGEGAGYAGGITSAAMDGIRVAEEIIGTG